MPKTAVCHITDLYFQTILHKIHLLGGLSWYMACFARALRICCFITVVALCQHLPNPWIFNVCTMDPTHIVRFSISSMTSKFQPAKGQIVNYFLHYYSLYLGKWCDRKNFNYASTKKLTFRTSAAIIRLQRLYNFEHIWYSNFFSATS